MDHLLDSFNNTRVDDLDREKDDKLLAALEEKQPPAKEQKWHTEEVSLEAAARQYDRAGAAKADAPIGDAPVAKPVNLLLGAWDWVSEYQEQLDACEANNTPFCALCHLASENCSETTRLSYLALRAVFIEHFGTVSDKACCAITKAKYENEYLAQDREEARERGTEPMLSEWSLASVMNHFVNDSTNPTVEATLRRRGVDRAIRIFLERDLVTDCGEQMGMHVEVRRVDAFWKLIRLSDTVNSGSSSASKSTGKRKSPSA